MVPKVTCSQILPKFRIALLELTAFWILCDLFRRTVSVEPIELGRTRSHVKCWKLPNTEFFSICIMWRALKSINIVFEVGKYHSWPNNLTVSGRVLRSKYPYSWFESKYPFQPCVTAGFYVCENLIVGKPCKFVHFYNFTFLSGKNNTKQVSLVQWAFCLYPKHT